MTGLTRAAAAQKERLAAKRLAEQQAEEPTAEETECQDEQEQTAPAFSMTM